MARVWPVADEGLGKSTASSARWQIPPPPDCKAAR
jgi:hypothetical protein